MSIEQFLIQQALKTARADRLAQRREDKRVRIRKADYKRYKQEQAQRQEHREALYEA